VAATPAYHHARSHVLTAHRPDPNPDDVLPPAHADPSDPPATLPPALAALRTRITERTATVAVVGMGYVGLPLLLAAAGEGFPVIGVDTDPRKVESLRNGRSYVVDVKDGDIPTSGPVQFGTDSLVLREADVVIIAVPTPLRDGSPDLSLVTSAASDIALVLRPGQLVVLESTTYPGTTEDLVLPLLEKSGLVAGHDFALAYSPERINPGGAWDFRSTPKIVSGLGPADAELAVCLYEAMVDRVVPTSSLKAAEMAKLIENTFRQVNIALVNELATIAPAIGVDLWDALDAAATKPFGYMPFWPGPGVGGHCIAIDPSYLSWKVEQRLGFGIGFIEHARSVNNRMPVHVVSRISEALNNVGRPLQGARLLVLGLTYKPGVNDVRESPALNVLGRLLDAGAVCSYHDPYVPSVDVGGRRHSDIPRVGPDEERPQLSSVELDEETLAAADCVVILTPHPSIDYAAAIAAAPLIFDAVGVTRDQRASHVVLL
jgi:UDP-N-acetyl-D-glucosamine dehydrogenase